MNNLYRIVGGTLLAVLISLVVLSHPSNAAKGAEITLSPAKMTIDEPLKPHSVYHKSFTLINSGQAKATVTVSSTPYSVQNEQYDPDYKTYTSFNQLSRWITFNQTRYELAPNQTIKIPYTITTPDLLPAGDQYAMLMAQMSSSTQSSNGNKVETQSRVGVKLLAHTVGKTIADASVTLPTIPRVITSNRHEFPITFTNNGNIDFQGTYTIKVTNFFNGKVLVNKSQTLQVLPTTKRALSVPWDVVQNIGLYRIEISATTTNGVVKSTKLVLAITLLGLIALLVLVAVIISGVARIIIKHRQVRTTFRKK